MNTYLMSGLEIDKDNPSSWPEIKIPEKFISDSNVRYWFIDKHFNAPISFIYTARIQNLFERIVDLLFTEAEEELLEEIFKAIPHLVAKQTLRLKVYRYQIENNFFETQEERWFAEGQVQLLERALYKSTVLMNMDPSNPVIPDEQSLETNIEAELVTYFLDDIPTRPARDMDKLDIGAGFLNTNPNAIGTGREFDLPMPDKRNDQWYEQVFNDLKRYLNSLDVELLDVSIIGIFVKIMQYVASGVDDFHVILSQKQILEIINPRIWKAMVYELEMYFFGGDSKRGEEIVEYLISNMNELKKLFANTIGGDTRMAQLNSYIERFQREYLEHMQNKARDIQVQMWEGYTEKERLEKIIAKYPSEEMQIRSKEALSRVKVGYGYSEVGITLVERHLRSLVKAYGKGMLDEFCMRRNLEAILNVSAFNSNSEIKDQDKFVRRVLNIIQGSPELLGFYDQLVKVGKAKERREVEG